MSKVDTLLKLIAYQKQHPQASDAEIAKGIGISVRHVERCKKKDRFKRLLTFLPKSIRNQDIGGK